MKTNNEDYLKKLILVLKKSNIDIYYADITQKEIKDAGFIVLKVFIPELFPLYFDENYPYFGISRLYQAPLKFNKSQKPKTETAINRIPHPVL